MAIRLHPTNGAAARCIGCASDSRTGRSRPSREIGESPSTVKSWFSGEASPGRAKLEALAAAFRGQGFFSFVFGKPDAAELAARLDALTKNIADLKEAIHAANQELAGAQAGAAAGGGAGVDVGQTVLAGRVADGVCGRLDALTDSEFAASRTPGAAEPEAGRVAGSVARPATSTEET